MLALSASLSTALLAGGFRNSGAWWNAKPHHRHRASSILVVGVVAVIPGSSLDRVDISGLAYALPEKLSMSVPFGVCHLLFNHRPKTAAGCLRFHSCASLYSGVSTDMWPPARYLLASRKTRESEGGKRGNTQWSRCSLMMSRANSSSLSGRGDMAVWWSEPMRPSSFHMDGRH